MGHFIGVTHKKYDSFAIALPNDITCWHFPKRRIQPQEALHLVLITDRAMRRDIYTNVEFEKALLKAPEQHKRRIRRRLKKLKKR